MGKHKTLVTMRGASGNSPPMVGADLEDQFTYDCSDSSPGKKGHQDKPAKRAVESATGGSG